MGRYSLVIENIDTKKQTIVGFNELNHKKNIKEVKTKVELATIDIGTLRFNNEEHLLAYFRNKGIIDFDHASIYITYQMDGTKYLPVVYKNYNYLLHFARNGATEVNINDYEFIKIVDKLINDCRNKGYFRFMKDKKYLNNYLINKITEYIYNPDNIPYKDGDYAFIRSKIAENMREYKVLRGIYVGDMQYYNLTNEKINDSSNYEDIIETYERGGYEEVYCLYDLDDLVKMDKDTQKKLGLNY